MESVAELVQNVYWNHKLSKNYKSDNGSDKVFDALPCVVYLNTVRFVAGFFRAEDILQLRVRLVVVRMLVYLPR
jgi:hypothetical protein